MIVARELDVISTEFSEEAAMQSGDMVRIIVFKQSSVLNYSHPVNKIVHFLQSVFLLIRGEGLGREEIGATQGMAHFSPQPLSPIPPFLRSRG